MFRLYVHQKFDKGFEITKTVKISRLEEDWGKLLAKIRFYRLSVTIYMGKSKKVKQNWKKPEKCDINFCASFYHYYQKLVFEEENGY